MSTKPECTCDWSQGAIIRLNNNCAIHGSSPIAHAKYLQAIETMAGKKKRKLRVNHSFPRESVAAQRNRVTRMLVKHVVSYYGRDDPLSWPTDMLCSLARTLKGLTPRNGW